MKSYPYIPRAASLRRRQSHGLLSKTRSSLCLRDSADVLVFTFANQPHTCTLRDPHAAVSTATSFQEKLDAGRKLSSDSGEVFQKNRPANRRY